MLKIRHPQAHELFREVEAGRPLELIAAEADPSVAATTLRRWVRMFNAGQAEIVDPAGPIPGQEVLLAEVNSERRAYTRRSRAGFCPRPCPRLCPENRFAPGLRSSLVGNRRPETQ